ncbi:MAG: S1-like domain-containing RNA-binding protein, partial [Fimbriimonas sp.]
MRIGEYQDLQVTRESPHGVYLADQEAEVLLPSNQVRRGTKIGDSLRVFVYTDSQDRPIATLKKPLATVGEFAKLRAVSVTGLGAFFDWGLDKDLLCPIREQIHAIREGDSYLVRLYLDEAIGRVVCTTNLTKYLRPDGPELEQGQKVKIMISGRVRDVMTVIIDGHIQGALFQDEWIERLEIGDVRDAYVKRVRPDDKKVAVSLRPQGYEAVLGERDRFVRALRAAE